MQITDTGRFLIFRDDGQWNSQLMWLLVRGKGPHYLPQVVGSFTRLNLLQHCLVLGQMLKQERVLQLSN